MKKLIVLSVIVILMLSGCGKKTEIKDIVNNPEKYRNSEVTVTGTVKTVVKIPFVDYKTYIITDGVKEINVTTKKELPKKGDKVKVKGKVDIGATIGGKNMGISIQELERL